MNNPKPLKTITATDAYPTAWLDTTRFGNASRFLARVPFNLRGQIAVGDRVWVADDSVEPFLCRVMEFVDDGRSARFQTETSARKGIPPAPPR